MTGGLGERACQRVCAPGFFGVSEVEGILEFLTAYGIPVRTCAQLMTPERLPDD